jgi:hypothetical protein
MIAEYEKVVLKLNKQFKKEHEIKKAFPELSYEEIFAYQHPDQWIGCLACGKSHHQTNFCACGSCYFTAPSIKQDDEGWTFVKCKCGKTNLWD